MQANRNETGVIFNIQKFSVNDGPGIRTVVFLKGCPLRCKWCANPESQLTKVQVLWDYKKCIQCGKCIDICHKHAIQMNNQSIHINHFQCDSCLQCISSCPQHALQKEGEIKTVQQVLDVVLQDIPFYEESGGGITLSGGEMLMQPEFSKQLYKASKEEGLHTACETTGYTTHEIFQDVIQDIDYILFDMKHYNPTTHKQFTGVDNKLILQNIAFAIQSGKTVLPRTPVIPGFNDSLEDAKALATTFHTIGATQVQLLPFHQFGENKYEQLQQDYYYKNTDALHKEDLQAYQQILIREGIHAFF